MPAPEQLLPTVQAMKLSLSDTPPEPSENKQEIKNLDSANGKVRFVCEYISTHYQENLSLEALAEISYLHPDYLSRIFKKETGMNLNPLHKDLPAQSGLPPAGNHTAENHSHQRLCRLPELCLLYPFLYGAFRNQP